MNGANEVIVITPDDRSGVLQKFVSVSRDTIRDLHPRIVDAARLPSREFSRKADGSLVTEIDHAVEEALTSRYRVVFPEIPIIAEEAETQLTSLTPKDALDYYSRVLSAPFVIAIDPIDGTKNFVEGVPEFCISVALAELGPHGMWPIASVIALPYAEEMYWRDANGVFVECLATATVREVQRPTSVGAALSISFKDRKWLSSLGYSTHTPLVTSGSSVHDFLSTALGRLRASLIGKQRVWDFMGPLAIAERLGLCLKDVETGERVRGFTAESFTPDIEHRPWGLVRKMLLVTPSEDILKLISRAPPPGRK